MAHALIVRSGGRLRLARTTVASVCGFDWACPRERLTKSGPTECAIYSAEGGGCTRRQRRLVSAVGVGVSCSAIRYMCRKMVCHSSLDVRIVPANSVATAGYRPLCDVTARLAANSLAPLCPLLWAWRPDWLEVQARKRSWAACGRRRMLSSYSGKLFWFSLSIVSAGPEVNPKNLSRFLSEPTPSAMAAHVKAQKSSS